MASRIFISAGEPSGDLLASELITALKDRRAGVEIFGVVGPKMLAAGAKELAHIEDLSVMGFVDVLKQIYHLKRLETILLEHLRRCQPQIAILVDYPGFHMRLAESIKAMGIPVVQYVAPQLWAWGTHRTKRLRRVTNLVLGIMPFETEFFRSHHLNFSYVGTPQADRVRALRQKQQVDDWKPLPGEIVRATKEGSLVGFFPGSRWGEVSRLLPDLIELRRRLGARGGDGSCSDPRGKVKFAFSLAPNLDLEVYRPLIGEKYGQAKRELEAQGYCHFEDFWILRGLSLELMDAVDAALVTSGTATLECALTTTPMMVAYRTSPLNFAIAKRLVRLEHISLVNLVAGREIVREFVQEYRIEDLEDELQKILFDQTHRKQAIEDLRSLHDQLHGNLAQHAAEACLKLISESSTCDLNITDESAQGSLKASL